MTVLPIGPDALVGRDLDQERRAANDHSEQNVRQKEEPDSTAEPDPLSFVIKLRPERADRRRSERLLRGSITHVPSGERRSIKSLENIADFIIPYLEQMKVRLGLLWRLRRWRQNLSRHLSR